MPRTFYTNETDIPENLKGAYEAKNGRWELTKLDDEHPVIATNKSLTQEQGRLKTQVTTLTTEKQTVEAERDEARNKAIPHGFRAVPKEVAELGEVAKQTGLSKDELPAIKTEVETLKSEKAKASRNETRAKAAGLAGFSADKFTKLAETEDFDVEIETVTENGKQIEKPFAVVKDAEGKPVKTAFSEFVEKHDKFSLVLDSLKDKEQKTHTPFPGKEKTTGGNIYDNIRKQVSETKTEKVDVGARFGRPETV